MKLVAHKFRGIFLESICIDYILILLNPKDTSKDYAKSRLISSFNNYEKDNIEIINNSKTNSDAMIIDDTKGIEIMSEYMGIGTTTCVKNIISSTDKHTEKIEDELCCFTFISYDSIIEKIKERGVLII